MAKVRLLSDEEFRKILASKYQDAKDRSDKMKVEYDIAEMAYQCINSKVRGALDAGLATQFLFTPQNEENQMPLIEGLDLAKAVLFLHSKLCISDPVITATPRKQDHATKKSAKYAQHHMEFLKRHVSLQEVAEIGAYLNCCIYGAGVTFWGWNPHGGEKPMDEIPEDFDIEQFEFKMEGDHDVRNVNPKHFYPDATADMWKNAEHCFEVMEIPSERAYFTFQTPEQQEILRTAHQNQVGDLDNTGKKEKSTVKLIHYWERGRPWNGFLGAHAIFVEPENPRILYRGPNPFKHKRLPYSILTDIDIPDNVMGMSRIIYAYQTQMCINNMITMVMDNMSLFGSAKAIMPEGGFNEDMIDNDKSLIGTYNPASGGKPEFFRPVNVTSDVWKAYDILKGYINNIYGMNEFSQGQIPRELSSYAVQLALEMDDKYRIRLFNKKKQYIKDLYIFGLEMTKQYVTEPIRLEIVGVEGFEDDAYFMSKDLVGEYDIDADYGAYLPVDPAARKQQLLEFLKSGMFEKAGGNMKKVASLLVDGSMLDMRDSMETSRNIQDAEISRLIKGEKVNVEPWDDDGEHAVAVEDFARTQTFEALPRDMKEVIWAHGEAHVKALAEKIAKSQGPNGAGGPMGQGGPMGGPSPGGAGGGAGMPIPPKGAGAPPAPPGAGAGLPVASPGQPII